MLFNDTIGYNIAYGREGAGEAEIERAARGAAIAGFIERQPDGYDDARRRARAEAVGRREAARRDRAHPAQGPADPDPRRSDQRARQPHRGEILDTLEAIERGRTTIVIAHRLSTVVDADQIVVLEAGRVVERGTHAALLRRNGLYAEMWARQAQERANRRWRRNKFIRPVRSAACASAAARPRRQTA